MISHNFDISFLVSLVLLEFKLLKYCFLHVLKFLNLYSFGFCNFASWHICKIYQTYYLSRSYYDLFSKAFYRERIVVISDLIFLVGSKWIWYWLKYLKIFFKWWVNLWNRVLKGFNLKVLIKNFIATLGNSLWIAFSNFFS